MSRFSRLYPAFWAAAGLTFVVVAWLGLPGREVSAGDFLVNLTMLPELFGVPAVDRVYWTLAVELNFYALMVLAAVTRVLDRLDWLGLAWVGSQGALVLASMYAGLPVPGWVVTLLILKYAHFFVAGMMVYQVWRGRAGTLTHLVVGLCLFNAQMMHGDFRAITLEPILLLLAVAVFYLIAYRGVAVLRWRPLVWLGGISYSLYLVHFHIGMAIMQSMYQSGASTWAGIAAATAAALLLATLLTYAVERPAMYWLRRRFRRKPFTTALSRS